MTPLEWRLARVESAAFEARHAVAAWLQALRVSDRPAHNAVAAVSELVANGIIHNGGDDIEVCAATSPGHVSIKVTSCLSTASAGTLPLQRIWRTVDMTSTSRALVAAIVDCTALVLWVVASNESKPRVPAFILAPLVTALGLLATRHWWRSRHRGTGG